MQVIYSHLKRNTIRIVIIVATVVCLLMPCVLPQVGSANAKTNQDILVQPVTSEGKKIGCFAVDVQSKTAPIVWENKEKTTAITFKSQDLGLPSSGKSQAIVRFPDHADQHNLNIVKGIVTVALNKGHFDAFKAGGTIELGNRKIRYKDISEQYQKALNCELE